MHTNCKLSTLLSLSEVYYHIDQIMIWLHPLEKISKSQKFTNHLNIHKIISKMVISMLIVNIHLIENW